MEADREKDVCRASQVKDNMSVEQLNSRICYLEEVLAGKDAALLAVTQELEAVREISCVDASIGPLASGFDVDFKTSIAEHNRKLQETSTALSQRDEMIEKLASALKQSVQDREELKTAAEHLTQQVHVLQRQLQSVGQHKQQPQAQLVEALRETEEELKKKTIELSQCKAQSSEEVKYLMSSLEQLQQRAVRCASTEKSGSISRPSTESHSRRDNSELDPKLVDALKRESVLKSKLETALAECEKLSLEVSSLKVVYEAQLSACSDQQSALTLTADYSTDKRLKEQLCAQCAEAKEILKENNKITAAQERDLQFLRQQLIERSKDYEIQRDKIQLLENQAEEYASNISVCHQTIEQYKKRFDDLIEKSANDLAHQDASHKAEVMRIKRRVSELQETNARQQNLYQQELNKMKQKQIEDLEMRQQSHENEVNTSKRDAERYRTDLREKANLLLLLEQQLAEEKQWSRTYSKQVQQLGEKLTQEEYKNDEYREKIGSLELQLKDIDQACTLYQPQIEFLQQQLIDERQKSTNILQQLEDVRKQLLLEQEKCKVFCEKIEAANSNITDLQRKNSELKVKASKLDEGASQLIKNEKQLNSSLQTKLETLHEQLKEEKSRSDSFRAEIEGLNNELNKLSSVDKTLHDVQVLLEKEQESSAKYKSEVSNLGQQLRDQEMKNEELLLQLEKKQAALEESKQQVDRLTEEFKHIAHTAHAEQQQELGMLPLEDERNSPDYLETCHDKRKAESSTEDLALTDNELFSAFCEKCEVHVKTLKSKLKVLSEANNRLFKTRQESELELANLRRVLTTAKCDFESTLQCLKEKLDRADEDIIKLRRQADENSLQKNEIHHFNCQIKDLLSTKALLESELQVCKEENLKEIKSLKTQVESLERKLKSLLSTDNDDSLVGLLGKCRDDVKLLRSVCFSNCPSSEAEEGFEHQESLSHSNSPLINENSSSCPRILSLEKLLDFCETHIDQREFMKFNDTQASQCSESNDSMGKLKLVGINELNHSLKSERQMLLAQNEALTLQLKQVLSKKESPETVPFLESSTMLESSSVSSRPKISDLISCWIKRCEYLEESNNALGNKMCALQAMLSEAEIKLSSHRLSPKKLSICDASEICKGELNFNEENSILKNTITSLRKELFNKELYYEEKIKNLMKKLRSSYQAGQDCDENFVNFIKEFSSKSNGVILLENELNKTQMDCHILMSENQNQKELLKKVQLSLEESWEECSTFELDLENALRENSTLRARLMRLEATQECSKQKKMCSDMMWQVMEDLSQQVNELKASTTMNQIKCKIPVIEKVESSTKIVKKMNTECESILATLLNGCDNVALSAYLQSEALGLRRLQANLTEIKQVLSSKCVPALQLHVELLQQQLEEEQARYQEMCEAHFSLEAEMREMENRFQQQEGHMQAILQKHKATAKLWQLKAETSELEVIALQAIKLGHECNLSSIFSEIDSICSQAVSALQDEVERVASLREGKVRLEMSEKILALEKSHKEQLEKVTKQIQGDNSIRALQVLHQQEIMAVQAECNYSLITNVNKLNEQFINHLKHPLLNNIQTSCNQLSLLLLKQTVVSQFNCAWKKMASSLQSDLRQKLISLETDVGRETFSDLGGLDCVISAAHNNSSLSVVEQLSSEVEELKEKILDLQRVGLQATLSSCEKKHKEIVGELQRMTSEVDSLCDLKCLQDRLLKEKEEHRLAIESITTRHKAEESRLRLLLSEQNETETSEQSETALSILRREMEEKHKAQMEELRTYFEQKCADFEKHYSEEVFSQHSRKLSDCSSASESEFVSEMYYAGPGCTVSGPSSHLCDSLGESNFKDFEEQSRSIDVEKLLKENQEQVETMRLALESRYQGELEAQKELYEARFEELLRTMSESHVAELKMQSRRLQDLQDSENSFKRKLLEAEGEISNLKHQLESISENENSRTSCKQCQSNTRFCTDLNENLKKQLQLEFENKFIELSQECDRKLNEKDVECQSKLKQLILDYKSKLSEELHQKNIENDPIFQEKLSKAIEEKKADLESEYAKYLEFVKNCADETKMQMIQRHEDELKEIFRKHENEILELKNSQEQVSEKSIDSINEKEERRNKILTLLSYESSLKESPLIEGLQTLLQICEEVELSKQHKFESTIIKIVKEINSWREKLHHEQEMRLENIQKESERRFHLQLEEARSDILQALERHIQELLSDDGDGEDKPIELQQLEKKFASKYQLQMDNMQRKYEAKISELCMKHANQLSSARSLKNQLTHKPLISEEDLNKLIKERDCLRNVAATLRDVVSELVRYFISWEDEFSNTLMDELVSLDAERDCDLLSVTHKEEDVLKDIPQTSEKDTTLSEDEIPIIIATPASGRRSKSYLKHVRFAPDISGILSLIDDGSLLESAGLNCSVRDASLNFQEELDRCLARLRCDSAALYALSKPKQQPALTPDIEETSPGKTAETLRPSTKLSSLSSTPEKNLTLEENIAETSESITQLKEENEDLRAQLNALHEELKISQADLLAACSRLESLEQEAYHRAEVVAEGYGQGEQSLSDNPSSPRATTMEELQDKARSLLLGTSNIEEVSGVMSPTSSQQHLSTVVEELCRDWERLAEESRRKQDDLQQQVDAADKQLKASRTFMDEQAAEREQERDDFVNEIKRLQELLKEKDRDRITQQQMNHEVETLENQLKDCQCTLQDTVDKFEKLSIEHKQAVAKIWTLRDIISDLEVQVATKAEETASVLEQNEALHQMVEQQGSTQRELALEMEELQLRSDNGRLAEKISHLEDQLLRHHLNSGQLVDPSAVEQMKSQIIDLVLSLEQHTKELECANASTLQPASPCLSSPSEDVSIRETLEAIRAATSQKSEAPRADPVLSLPLQEMSQLLEQWQRHARADDAVLKKIRDVDMQFDDVVAEKNALVTRLQEQMIFSSSLQAKLDEHRRKSDVKLSQAIGEFQSQVEDLKNEIHNYAETLESREKQIQNLRSSLQRAETELKRQQSEVKKSSEIESNLTTQLQYQVSKLSAEKKKLQAIISEKNSMHESLPTLVESMLIEKNADIDLLQKQVKQLTRQMESSSCYVASPSTTLEFEYCESEKVRAHVALSPILELRRNSPNITAIDESSNVVISPYTNKNSTCIGDEQERDSNMTMLNKETDMSLKSLPLEVTLSETTPLTSNQSSGSLSGLLSSSSETCKSQSFSDCEYKLASLEHELEKKDNLLSEYLEQLNDKCSTISKLESDLKNLHDCKEKLKEAGEELRKVQSELQEALRCNDFMKNEHKVLLDTKDLEIQHLKDDLLTSQTNLRNIQNRCQDFDESDKESEIQRLRAEVCATQAIVSNLQRKVQEAKQIARSPSRSSPENNQALRAVQNELEAAKSEIVELKNFCKSIKSDVEKEYLLKQTEFETMLKNEQEANKALLESLTTIQEDKTSDLEACKNQLEQLNDLVKEKEEQNDKLKSEINQLNMECVAIKNQLSAPVNEAAVLAVKLLEEKKFSDTLKEELLLFKNKSSSLDKECQVLRERLSTLEGKVENKINVEKLQDDNQCLIRELSKLKTTVEKMSREKTLDQKKIDNLIHENTLLKEENSEVGKELSDMKRVIIQMHDVKTSSDEVVKNLQSEVNELNQAKIHSDLVGEELSSLRKALKNLSSWHTIVGLSKEDIIILKEMKKQLPSFQRKGAGDGPWNNLSFSKTYVHEICPPNQLADSESLDDLTGMVQHELNLSKQLDNTLIETLDPLKGQKLASGAFDHQQSVIERPALELSNVIPEDKGREVVDQERISVSEVQDRDKELFKLKTTVQLLHSQLEAEQAQYYALQQQDCFLLEEMRIKLSDALDGQASLRLQLQAQLNKHQPALNEKDGFEFGNASTSQLNDKIEKLQELLNEAMLDLKKLRVEKDASEKQLRRLQEAEIQRSRRRAVTEEKHRRQIDQLQALQSETQQECMALRQKLASVNQKLQQAEEDLAKDRSEQLKTHIPFVERLKGMNTFLEEHIEENVRMAKQMEDLTEEHRKLRSRIAQLEQQLADRQSNESMESANLRFAAERSNWESERKLLLVALSDLKQKLKSSPDSDVEDRISHLFGRYLRMQSYRKALVWQKRYLLSVISGINDSKSLTASHFASLTTTLKRPEEKLHKSCHNKFRSAVMVIIAIHRMQFMVERWHRGKRIGCGVVVQQTLSHYAYSASMFSQGHQPQCSKTQNHVSAPADVRLGPSLSPPVLERPRPLRPQFSSSSQLPRMSMSSGDFETVPRLSESVTNFHMVQKRFDSIFLNPPK